jgi:chromosome segregation ATPase
LKDLDDKFGELERRVRALMAHNKSLAARIGELEQELLSVRREVKVAEHRHGKNQQIRDKIENILRALDSINAKKGD